MVKISSIFVAFLKNMNFKIFSQKATKNGKIFTVDLTLCCKSEDFEIFVTLENPNFMYKFDHLYVLLQKLEFGGCILTEAQNTCKNERYYGKPRNATK